MLSSTNLGIFGSPLHGTLYIVNDTIWLAQTVGTRGRVQRVGSLSGWLKSFAQYVPCGSKANFPDHVSWFEEMRFCLCSLIPYLRFLDTGNEADLRCSSEIEQEVSKIMRKEALLRGSQSCSLSQPIPLDLLQKNFCVPCMVSSNQVIPLEPASTPVYSALKGITVSYRHCTGKAQPLGNVLVKIREAVIKGPNQENTANNAQKETAELIQEVDHLISRFEPVDLGRFKIIYYDRYHQVHYNRGHFVLVHGPVHQHRAGKCGSIYVGLTISGATRTEWLMRAPRPCKKPEEFWSDAGTPISQGMCMGNHNQYRRLQTSFFSDAEAVVQWLDAGVILTSGISLFHKEQRNLKMKEVHQRNSRLVRSQLENELRKKLLSLSQSRSDGKMLPHG
jgi:hypothetical protein